MQHRGLVSPYCAEPCLPAHGLSRDKHATVRQNAWPAVSNCRWIKVGGNVSGPTNVRANSAASSSVRTVTSRERRRGGSNTKFVMHRKRASHNRSSGGAICLKYRRGAPGANLAVMGCTSRRPGRKRTALCDRGAGQRAGSSDGFTASLFPVPDIQSLAADLDRYMHKASCKRRPFSTRVS